jgi:hypothetical protein
MKYKDKISVLREYPNHAYNTGDIDFEVDGQILSIPVFPFTILNLKDDAGRVIKGGWEFYVGRIRFYISGEQMHIALSRYLEENKHIPIERFMDPYEH